MKCTLGVGHRATQAAVDLSQGLQGSSGLRQVSSIISTAPKGHLKTCCTNSILVNFIYHKTYHPLLCPISVDLSLSLSLPAAIVFQLRMNPGGGRVGRTNKTDTDSAAAADNEVALSLSLSIPTSAARVYAL